MAEVQVPKKKPFRPDIQGLRALAVVAVILDHLLAWPGGGFVGVDVFFVISGFLITSHLYREHQKHGRISFADFYRRRVRRILPIATLVLALTVGAGFALYLATRAYAITVDALWALFFAANWHFAVDGTNYWANDGIVSPLQQYWSLAVEEQYYFVWPLLIVLVLGAGSMLGWAHRSRARLLTTVLMIGVAASFAWALWETATNPTWAYFSTFSRAWELGVGAILAITASSFGRIPPGLRPVLGWIGLLGIVASIYFVKAGDGFPGPWAVLPVLSTGLVIASGTGGEQRFLLPLMNPVTSYIGDISYSLYLWHFPVIIFLASAIPNGITYTLSALVITFGLAIASYHFVENRIRTSSWLEPGRRDKERKRRRSARPVLTRKIAALSVLGVCTAALCFASLAPAHPPASVAAVGSTPRGTDSSSEASKPAVDKVLTAASLAKQISAALHAKQFPEFVPSVDSLGTQTWIRRVLAAGCGDIDAKNEESCTTGTGAANKDVVVIGDSFGIAWTPAIRGAFEPLGWRVHPMTMGQCPSGWLTVTKDKGAPYTECDQHRQWALQQVEKVKPDIVILADAHTTIERLASGATGASAKREITTGFERTIRAVSADSPRVIVLSAPPEGAALQECVTRLAEPSDCTRRINDNWNDFTTAARSATKGTDAEFIDTHLWFCNQQGLCPGFVGVTPVRVDVAHLTPEYSAMLTPVLATAIAPQ